MSNQTTTTFTFNQIKFIVSVFACSLCFFSSSAYKPYFLLAGFFAYQAVIQYMAYYQQKSESQFVEHFWTAPAKLLVALLMVMSGIPSENTGWGLVWIGLAVLLMTAGIRSLYFVMKSFNGGNANVPAKLSRATVKQLKKAEKQDEALMADLASFLGESGPTEKGQSDV